ncbi:MAG: plasmid maintenance system killer protein [Candidatus Dadabacteria bacterium]|nr:MAG: plasmid maintenance system killer protein [Candidatus Dadabacteria bacterium]
MIVDFADKETRDIYDGVRSKRAIKRLHPDSWPKAQRLLDQLNRVTRLEMMNIPPNNRLHKLKGSRAGQWAVWITASHRLVFRWTGTDARDVEIVDYHDE